MKSWVIFLLCVLVFFISPSHATIYTGSLQYTPPFPPDSGDGLNVQSEDDNWPTYNVSISWTVTNEDTSHPGYPWKYTYTFGHDGNKSGISHIIIEASTNFASTDLEGVTGATFDSVKTQTVQSGNTGMPEDVYGIRFNPTSSGQYSMTWTFWSTRAPVWGDFYVKDGGTNYAYNYNNTGGVINGFVIGDVDPTAPPANGSVDYHILRPDAVPEPMTLGMILLGSWLISKKRQR
jgi:hypothetical protein